MARGLVENMLLQTNSLDARRRFDTGAKWEIAGRKGLWPKLFSKWPILLLGLFLSPFFTLPTTKIRYHVKSPITVLIGYQEPQLCIP